MKIPINTGLCVPRRGGEQAFHTREVAGLERAAPIPTSTVHRGLSTPLFGDDSVMDRTRYRQQRAAGTDEH
jgi:hypothetical protein